MAHDRRSIAVRGTVSAAVAVALVGAGLVGDGALAASKPQRVLQSVNVDLGSDGTLYGIKSLNVRKEDGEKATSDKVTLDPTKTAGELPVRVLTSYRAGKKSGTNLKDLKGYDGPLEIDVTVQNTTVKPQKLSYDSGGSTKSAYGLVGVPLTVVASSSLGKDAVDQVVTKSDSGGATTNGVLSQDDDGNAVVQWASILAPPQLAPSTTFRLVMNAKDFSLPSLDLSVQPGLAADSSLSSLLGSAFGSDSSSQLAMQTRTISLITDVTGVLAAAGDQLLDVRKQLNFSAGQLGDKTIGDLTSSTGTVSSSTKDLATSLTSLGTNLGSTLKQSKDTATQALQGSVEEITKSLGDPNAAVPTFKPTGAGCAQTVKPATSSGTVIGQLNQVSGLLNALGSTTGGCRDAVVTALSKSIGSLNPDGTPNCATDTTSALCAVESANASASSVINNLGTVLAAAKDSILKNTTVTSAQDAVSTIETKILQLQQLAKDPLGQNSPASQLDALNQGIQDIRNKGLGGTLTGVLDTTHATAEKELVLIGQSSSSSGSSSYSQLSQLRAGLSASSATDDQKKTLQGLVDQLTTNTDSAYADWTAVAAATSSDSDAYKSLTALDGALSDLQAKVTAIKAGNYDGYIGVVQGLYALYTPPTFVKHDQSVENPKTDATEVTCDNRNDPDYVTYPTNTPGDAANPNNQVLKTQLAVLNVYCDRQADADKVGAGLDTTGVTDAQGQLVATEKKLDANRQLSSSQINGLFSTASNELKANAAKVHKDGQKTVVNARSGLTSSQKKAAGKLDGYVVSALKSIDSSVSGSTRDLQASADLLSGDLKNVLSDLGSRDKKGSGLLGVVQAQAATTRTSSEKVADAAAQASSFGNVRSEDLNGIFLQSAQLQAALAQQSDLAPFALKLPNGSQHVSVYSFHMREVK